MIDYELCVWLTNTIGIATFIFMLITCWPYVVSFFVAFKKVPKVPHSDLKTKFAVIIPARNEAKVIRKNLQSLLKQTYDKNYYDIWVIIESEKDPTSLICKKLGVHYFVRPNIENRKTKGFAIQDLHNYFEENHMNYDAYMIFDADNIVTSRYLEIMNDLRQTGVEVGSGYRNFTNANVNWVSCSSAIFFAYMMSITSNMRTFLFNKATICGTGYYINTDIIREAGGWIFTGMTEDIEVTVYCYYHNINMRYYPEIEFFDEQCDKASTLHKQMTRWIWGYFASKKKFKKGGVNHQATTKRKNRIGKLEFNFGIYPFVVFTLSNLLLFLAEVIIGIQSVFFKPNYTAQFFGYSFIHFGILYGTFMFIALVVIIKNNKKLRFNEATVLASIVTYPWFWIFVLSGFFDGMFHKEKRVTWATTEHSGQVTTKIKK